jgi:hypothetical protein
MRKTPTLRLILLAIVMAGLIVAGAFPQIVPASLKQWFADDDSAPRAVACRAETLQKYPTDLQTIGAPDGTSKTMINRNANAYAEAYAACIKR